MRTASSYKSRDIMDRINWEYLPCQVAIHIYEDKNMK